MLGNVGRLSHGELDGENTQRPNIDLIIVLTSPLDKLWCHPADGSNFGLSALLLLGKNDCVAEICKFNLSVGLYEDVV